MLYHVPVLLFVMNAFEITHIILFVKVGFCHSSLLSVRSQCTLRFLNVIVKLPSGTKRRAPRRRGFNLC